LGCLDVSPGTRLANIVTMPDVQVSPASKNAQKKKGWLAVVLALALGAAGIFVRFNPQRSTSAAEGASGPAQ
jgi:uncharacterized protein HemX